MAKNYTPKRLLGLVERKFGVKLSEGNFWSESYKAFKELENLQPLLIAKSKKERKKIIKEMKEYFIEQSTKYLNQILSSQMGP
ncbi:MAG: hypothetical protein LR000_01665 [Candidatus Pacebacteria bacterium]|nr:hypothetical protein [Candidatus Paceibacterota bacterium]